MKKNKREILLILIESMLLIWYLHLGKFDWEYGFDLPYRLVFGAISYVMAVIILGAGFYFIGKRKVYKNDKILWIPVIFSILSVTTLIRTDIIYISRFCIYNAFLILGILKSKIELKTTVSSVAKIVFWFIIMYFFLPFIFIIFIGSLNFFIEMIIWIVTRLGEESYLSEILYFIEWGLANIYFGYLIRKHFTKSEIRIVRVLTILGCIIMVFIFLLVGFSWHREDYYWIIYTFHYKVLMYLIGEEGSKEIIKTIYSIYFFYNVYTCLMFYVGTLIKSKKIK